MLKFKEFLTESNLLVEFSLSRFKEHLDSGERPMGLISAERSDRTGSRQENAAENNKLTAQLRREIRAKGYAMIPVIGKFIETDKNTGKDVPVEEQSFLIIGDDIGEKGNEPMKKDLQSWAKKFDQQTFILITAGNPRETISYTAAGQVDMDFGTTRYNRMQDYMTYFRKPIKRKDGINRVMRSIDIEPK